MLIGNSPEWLMVVLLIVMNSDGLRSLRVANTLRYFTGKFTELSNSEFPNLTVMGVTYRSLRNLISAAWAIWRSYAGGGGRWWSRWDVCWRRKA